MKTKVVYVLVSQPKDYYYEQLLISVFSLRRFEKECDVIVFADRDTVRTLNNKRSEIFNYVSSVVTIDIPDDFSQIQKSRYLKTHIRKYVDGDYLFIDTDTVICDSLCEIDLIKHDVCAVADSNASISVTENDEWIISNARKVGWKVIGKSHFNSGIMYVRDTPLSHSLYERWFENWQYCVNKGVNIDQLSLLRTNEQMGYPIHELPAIWNCQIQRKGLDVLSSAKIIHYLSSNKMSVYYLLGQEETFKRIKEIGSIPDDIIDLISSPRIAFSKDSRMIGGRQIEYFKSPLYELFLYYPKVFKLMSGIASSYLKTRAVFGRIRNSLVSN